MCIGCLPVSRLPSYSATAQGEWEGVDEVEEEEEEEHAEDGTNNKLINPTVDDGARCDGGSGRRRAAAVTTIAAIAVWLGHVVSADLVQVYRGANVGPNTPTDVELRCTPHHLINVVDPPPRCCHCRHRRCHHII